MRIEMILEEMTRICSQSVKRKYGSIVPDCHNASGSLADYLNQKGYPARAIKVYVLLPKRTCFDHSVVLALNRYILDPTFGQFHEDIPGCPDYFMFEEQGMLDANNKYAVGESDLIASVKVSDSEVAYFPGNSPLKARLEQFLNVVT